MKKQLLACAILVSASAAIANGSDKVVGASLNGASVVNGGDADGTGSFSAVISEDSNQLCYSLSVANIGAVGVAHIHEGDVGMPGRPVVELTVSGSNCVEVNHSLLEDIKNHPSDYYIDVVHASTGTDAVRGQIAG